MSNSMPDGRLYCVLVRDRDSEPWRYYNAYKKVGPARGVVTHLTDGHERRSVGRRQAKVAWIEMSSFHDLDDEVSLADALVSAESTMLEAGERAAALEKRLKAGETVGPAAKRKRALKNKAVKTECPTCGGSGDNDYLRQDNASGPGGRTSACGRCQGTGKIAVLP